MTQKKKNLSKILINFMKNHKKKIFKWKINDSKKKNVSQMLMNFMKIHKIKKNLNRKSIYDPKKEKSFENIHIFHKNSKTYFGA